MKRGSHSTSSTEHTEEAAPPTSTDPGAAGFEEPPQNREERAEAPTDHDTIDGDRGASSLSGVRTLQSRITNVLAIGLMSTLGVGLLGWYYARTASQPSVAKHAAQAASQTKAEGDLPLPPLGKIDPRHQRLKRCWGRLPSILRR